MSCKELIQGLIPEMGGKLKRKDGADFWCIEVDGFVAEAEPFWREQSGSVFLGFDCSIGNSDFGKVANKIMGARPSEFVSLKWFQAGIEVSPAAAEKNLREIMGSIARGLAEESLDHYISEFVSDLPAGPSMSQVCHLAALAWTGDVATLQDYRDRFEQGDRLGLVPMIDGQTLDRALDIGAKMRARAAF